MDEWRTGHALERLAQDRLDATPVDVEIVNAATPASTERIARQDRRCGRRSAPPFGVKARAAYCSNPDPRPPENSGERHPVDSARRGLRRVEVGVRIQTEDTAGTVE